MAHTGLQKWPLGEASHSRGALLFGVVFHANIYVFRQTPYVFTGKNTTVSISLLLMIVSMVICLILIGYAFALRRFSGGSVRQGSHRGVLGVLALLTTMWSLQVNRHQF